MKWRFSVFQAFFGSERPIFVVKHVFTSFLPAEHAGRPARRANPGTRRAGGGVAERHAADAARAGGQAAGTVRSYVC